MEFQAKQIAQLLGGTVEGNPELTVNQFCKIEEGQPGGLAFLANPKYTHYIYDTLSSVVIVRSDFVAERPIPATLIRVTDPYLSFAELLKMYNQMQQQKNGISSLAFVAPTAQTSDGCYIGEFAVIGENVRIGKDVKIYPQVYIGDNCQIGDNTVINAGVKIYADNIVGQRCIIHCGCVIGADGFGFAPKPDGTWDKIPQIGNVVVDDDVEIGANTCIDRATMGSTHIHNDVKIDNLCQIAHNVVVGNNTAMAAQSGIAGSGKVGSNCILAGQVGVVGHITVGDHVTIGSQSGVTNNVESNQIVLGSPAIEAHRQRRNYVLMRNLDKLNARIAALEKEIKGSKA